MRRLSVAVLAAAVLALSSAVPARAAEEDTADVVAGDTAGTQPWRFEARALDYSAMLRSGHGAQGTEMPEVALANVAVRVLVRAPGVENTTLEGRTDVVGGFALAGSRPPPGATLEFFVAGEDGDDARPGFYGRPWAVDDGDPPGTVAFYQVATEVPRGLMLGQVINIVTTVDRDETTKVIQVRHTAMLFNRDFEVWLGDVARDEFVTFGIRVPDGFELRNVTVNNQDMDKNDVVADGHGATRRWVYRQPVFPGMQGPLVFQAIFVAPYVDGRSYDLTWHNEYPVMQYTMNIEKGLFTYLPPDDEEQGVGLIDRGLNAAMGNTKKVTHSYQLQQIPPHQKLSARFMAGHPFPWKAVTWTGAILLLAVGAGLLGYVASRPRAAREEELARAERRVKIPTTAAGREHEIEMLDRRLRRGEITSVEYDVRRAAVEKTAAAAPRKPPLPPGSAKKRGALDVAAISGRVENADIEQLRDDVRALLKAVRELRG